MTNNAWIFGAGGYYGLPFQLEKDDLLIAADGGLAYMRREGLMPHALIGDFDSGSIPDGINCRVISYPVHKDETDMQLAISHGLSRGARNFFLFGGTGGREDHTFANYACLAHLALLGRSGYLFGDGYVCTVLRNRTLTLPDDIPFPLASGTLSVFAFGKDAEGVTLSGFAYDMQGLPLFCHIPTGVSNQYEAGHSASITVSDGMLLLYLPIQKGTTYERN